MTRKNKLENYVLFCISIQAMISQFAFAGREDTITGNKHERGETASIENGSSNSSSASSSSVPDDSKSDDEQARKKFKSSEAHEISDQQNAMDEVPQHEIVTLSESTADPQPQIQNLNLNSVSVSASVSSSSSSSASVHSTAQYSVDLLVEQTMQHLLSSKHFDSNAKYALTSREKYPLDEIIKFLKPWQVLRGKVLYQHDGLLSEEQYANLKQSLDSFDRKKRDEFKKALIQRTRELLESVKQDSKNKEPVIIADSENANSVEKASNLTFNSQSVSQSRRSHQSSKSTAPLTSQSHGRPQGEHTLARLAAEYISSKPEHFTAAKARLINSKSPDLDIVFKDLVKMGALSSGQFATLKNGLNSLRKKTNGKRRCATLKWELIKMLQDSATENDSNDEKLIKDADDDSEDETSDRPNEAMDEDSNVALEQGSTYERSASSSLLPSSNHFASYSSSTHPSSSSMTYIRGMTYGIMKPSSSTTDSTARSTSTSSSSNFAGNFAGSSARASCLYSQIPTSSMPVPNLSELYRPIFAASLYDLAQRYATGNRVSKNWSFAIELLKLAASSAHGEANYELGKIYQKGSKTQGIQRDDRTALYYFQQAERLGYPKAHQKVAELQEFLKNSMNQSEATRTNNLQSMSGVSNTESIVETESPSL